MAYAMTCISPRGKRTEFTRGTFAEAQHAVARHLRNCHGFTPTESEVAYAMTEAGGRLRAKNGAPIIEVRPFA